MFNVGGPEVLVILLVALIALGPGQLPEAARKVGKVMSEIRKVSTSFQNELTSAFDMEQQPTKPKSAGGPTVVAPTPATDDVEDAAADEMVDLPADEPDDEPADDAESTS